MNSTQEIQLAQAEWRDAQRDYWGMHAFPDGCHTYYVRAWKTVCQTTERQHRRRRARFRRPHLRVRRDRLALIKRADAVICRHRARVAWDASRWVRFLRDLNNSTIPGGHHE